MVLQCFIPVSSLFILAHVRRLFFLLFDQRESVTRL
jgi:hypothetical protein